MPSANPRMRPGPSRTTQPRRPRGLIVLCALVVSLTAMPAAAQTRRVNAPYFPDGVRSSESAVFWFGRVDPSQNYTDVRIAYTDDELWVRLAIFDQWLWLDDAASRTPASLVTWDAATLVLDTGSGGSAPAGTSYRFVGELSSFRPRTDYQAAYRGTGTAWGTPAALSFVTETGWRGDALNNSGPDRGWNITFRIPFSSLGLVGPPASGTTWRLGVQVHDRDSQTGTAVSDKFWPETFAVDQPSSWGQLGFGLRPAGPASPSGSTVTIRHGLDGAVVRDGMVGGGSTCAEGVDFFRSWGSLNYARSETLVVQNQADVADWPCFSKFYVDFPLTALTPGRTVSAATLTVYQFGGSDPTQALRSFVQVSTVRDPWDESSVTWNTAPLAGENVAVSRVEVIPSPGLPWPGAARTWDLSWAVAQAYAAGQSTLRLVLYSADGGYHSGKYFSSSDVGDWNAVGRPTLQVVLSGSGGVPDPPTNLRILP